MITAFLIKEIIFLTLIQLLFTCFEFNLNFVLRENSLINAENALKGKFL